ncbi:MAG: acyl-CoA synthetase [Pseudomonadota bacterium]
MSVTSPYDQLPQTPANHQPLTPLPFLERAAMVFPGHPAIMHGDLSWSYAEFYARSRRLASALQAHGIGKNDTVSTLLHNTPPQLEAHYGVPMAGAVLNALNTRLDAETIGFILGHGEAKAVIVDKELTPVLRAALEHTSGPRPIIIDYIDPTVEVDGAPFGAIEYEAFLASGDPGFDWEMPGDEWDAITLNYTSGTTGDPKGVVYHHRGANLLATGNVVTAAMGKHPVYLWTLPMFHCNGWCFPWSVSINAGTHVCLRYVRDDAMYDAIARRRVTHLCGAPIVMSLLLNASEDVRRDFDWRVEFLTAAAPPPESVLAGMASAGFDVTHVYGLTEVYGPAVVNEWKRDWDALSAPEQAAKKARQGVRYAALEGLTVLDPQTMAQTPPDGETMGEVMMRGNVVMKGYLKNAAATEKAFAGGWFHTGDLGVMHPDGYVQLKDRSKDIIISGGENISSIEVEEALFKHPEVISAAVVAMPDEKWGETPCAFVELRDGATLDEAAAIAWCRDHLAHFKCPRKVVFGELPKTSTGKIQKFVLRERAKET